MLPNQPITLRTCDKELAAVCTGTTVLSKFEIFICKWASVNASNSSTISINKISTLNHEILYDPMEGSSFVSYWNTIFSELSSAELPEVLCRLRHHVCKQLDLHETNLLAANADIKEDHWID
uniref:Predicted gene, 17728 n=1 Tax=Cricetulus griseus TaxID=10029 RepID=A0A8C2MK61_CRIGR